MFDTKKQIIDLTQTLSASAPSWDGDCGFILAVKTDYKDCSGPDFFRIQEITTRAGMGTHIDAPAHCFSGAQTVDCLNPESLITNCIVINVSEIADEKFIITPEIVSKFENEHGLIQPNSFVLFQTGWSRFWNEPEKYRNNLQFPSVHEDTAMLLLERSIAGLGTDTLSADALGHAFPVHRAILGAGKYLVENVADASAVPATGAQALVLPMKIKEGTEAPVRLMVLA